MSISANNNLSADSYESQPQGQPYFATPELSQRLDLLKHLIENSDLVPLVQGPEGAGKTSMLFQLQLQANSNWQPCIIESTPMLHPDQLMVRLARFFNVSDADDNLRDHLIRHFEMMREQGHVPVILVDDVDQLPPASLIALLRLHERRVGEVPLVAVVFFALPAIEQTLTMPQLQVMNLQLFHLMDMPSVSSEQAPNYMRFLLQTEGLSQELALSDGQLDPLLQTSEGWPGRLAPLILEAISEDIVNVRPEKPKPAMKGGLLLLAMVVVALVLLFQEQINQAFAPGSPDPMPVSDLPLPKSSDKGAMQQASTVETEGEPVALSPDEVDEVPVPSLPEEISIPDKPPEVVKQKLQPLTEATTNELPPQAEPVVVEAGPVSIVVEELPAVEKNKPVPDISESTAEKEFIAIEPEPVAAQQAEGAQKVEPEVPSSAVTTASENKQTKASEKQPVVPVASKVKRRDEWLLAQKPTDFTLQLIGVGQLKSIDQFVSRHGLKEELFYIQTVRKGKPWYALMYGVFPSKEAAKSAIKRELPKSLHKRGMWARSMESVQQELEAR